MKTSDETNPVSSPAMHVNKPSDEKCDFPSSWLDILDACFSQNTPLCRFTNSLMPLAKFGRFHVHEYFLPHQASVSNDRPLFPMPIPFPNVERAWAPIKCAGRCRDRAFSKFVCVIVGSIDLSVFSIFGVSAKKPSLVWSLCEAGASQVSSETIVFNLVTVCAKRSACHLQLSR